MNIQTDYLKIYPNYKIYGPYIRSDDRTYYVLVKKQRGKIRRVSKRKSILRSRLKMEIRIGRKLKTYEEVDHKDHNKRNDKIRNLQVIGCNEHKSKDTTFHMQSKLTRKSVVCPVCSSAFICSKERWDTAKSKRRKPCCCKTCASVLYAANQYTVGRCRGRLPKRS